MSRFVDSEARPGLGRIFSRPAPHKWWRLESAVLDDGRAVLPRRPNLKLQSPSKLQRSNRTICDYADSSVKMGKAAALPYRVDVPKLDNLTDSMTWSQDAGGRKNDKNALDCPGLKCFIWQRKGGVSAAARLLRMVRVCLYTRGWMNLPVSFGGREGSLTTCKMG